jgi:hypothetical protein
MTERTITEAELKDVLNTTALIIGCPVYDSIMETAFPPIFEPKEGEAIWTSFFGSDYNLTVFSHMDNGEYVCFEEGTEGELFFYIYAKPLTPTQKGE